MATPKQSRTIKNDPFADLIPDPEVTKIRVKAETKTETVIPTNGSEDHNHDRQCIGRAYQECGLLESRTDGSRLGSRRNQTNDKRNRKEESGALPTSNFSTETR